DFAVQDKAKLLASRAAMAALLARLTTGLAGVSLLVGGTGILAIMLLSVRERRAESGLRMALRATPRGIRVQLLLEATVLALGGGGGGSALGALGAGAVALGTAWKVRVWAGAVLASLAMAAATGLGFGTIPARKASLVPPIEALGEAGMR